MQGQDGPGDWDVRVWSKLRVDVDRWPSRAERLDGRGGVVAPLSESETWACEDGFEAQAEEHALGGENPTQIIR